MTCEGESPVRLEELLAGKSYPSRFEQKTPIGFFTLAYLFAIPIPFFNKSERERERESFPLPKMAMTIEGTNSLAPLDHAHNSLILLLLWFQFFVVLKIELDIRVLAANNIWDYGG